MRTIQRNPWKAERWLYSHPGASSVIKVRKEPQNFIRHHFHRCDTCVPLYPSVTKHSEQALASRQSPYGISPSKKSVRSDDVLLAAIAEIVGEEP